MPPDTAAAASTAASPKSAGPLSAIAGAFAAMDPAEEGRHHLIAKPWFLHLLIFFVSVALIVSRRPDLILRAQFWAEGGHTWYVDAHDHGLAAFGFPCGGSLDSFPRVWALLVQGLPLHFVPAVFNLIAAVFHALNVNLLFTKRLRDVFPHSWMRWVVAAVLIGLPGSGEVLADISNVHNSHLPLTAAFLLLLAAPPRTTFWRVFDTVIVVLFSLSGPFCEAMAPLLFVRWLLFPRLESGITPEAKDRRWLLAMLGITTVCAVLQVVMVGVVAPALSAKYMQPGSPIMYNTAYAMQRHRGVTGASLPLFVGVVGGKVIFATLFGDYRWYRLVHQPDGPPLGFRFALVLTLLTLPVLVRAALHFDTPATRRLALFFVFVAGVFAGTLAFPLAEPVPAWILWVFDRAAGNRYWFIPAIGFVIALVTVAARERLVPIRAIAILLLLCLPVGLVREWGVPPLPDAGFAGAARAYDAAPPGTPVLIPSQPGVESGAWSFYLTKH